MEMENNNSKPQTPKPTLKRKQRKLRDALVHESRPSRRIKARKESEECMKISNGNSSSSSSDEDDDGESWEDVDRKIEELQRIVPGGESLGVDKLFEETAGYIMTLQVQVKAMKALASFFEGLKKESKKKMMVIKKF